MKRLKKIRTFLKSFTVTSAIIVFISLSVLSFSKVYENTRLVTFNEEVDAFSVQREGESIYIGILDSNFSVDTKVIKDTSSFISSLFPAGIRYFWILSDKTGESLSLFFESILNLIF